MKANYKSYFKFVGLLLCSSFLLFACSETPANVKKKEQLHLQASDSVINEGGKISFKVSANGSPVNANIYIDSSRIDGSTYTFYYSGTYTAIAKKEGYLNSEKVKIQVNKSVEKVGHTFTSMYVSDGDVYITGVFIPLGPLPNRNEAVYWKNGILHYLGGNGIVATSIYVASGDVYVAGYASYPFHYFTVGYWKNGKEHILANSGATKSIYVSNDDVYVTGYEHYFPQAVYWKNGTPHELADGKRAVANAIYLSEDDVYVAGSKPDFLGPRKVDFYWKNGTRHNLSISGTANSMYVADGNVYLAGYVMVNSVAVAAFWKNGTLHKLSDGKANSIYVNGGNVDVAGWKCDGSQCIVKYWKNGALVHKYQISGSPDLSLSFISNGDIYVVGAADGKLLYWKNGIPHKLDKLTSDAEGKSHD
jgi:hypothetical protein